MLEPPAVSIKMCFLLQSRGNSFQFFHKFNVIVCVCVCFSTCITRFIAMFLERFFHVQCCLAKRTFSVACSNWKDRFIRLQVATMFWSAGNLFFKWYLCRYTLCRLCTYSIWRFYLFISLRVIHLCNIQPLLMQAGDGDHMLANSMCMTPCPLVSL